MNKDIINDLNYQENRIKDYIRRKSSGFVDEHDRQSLLNLAGMELKTARQHYKKATTSYKKSLEYIIEYQNKMR